MKNRIVMLVLAAALIVSLVFVGCAKPTPAPGPTPTPTPTPAPEGEVFEWAYQQTATPASYLWPNAEEFCDRVRVASDGRLDITLHMGGSVCPITKEFEAVHNGVLDLGSGACAWTLELIPTASIFGFPVGGMDSRGMGLWYYYGGGTELWNRATERFNIVSLPQGTFEGHSPEVWCCSTVPITGLDSLKGKNMRCSGDGGAILNRLGGTAVFMPGGEAYEALQRGVIDMAELTGPKSFIDGGYYEIAQYYYFSSSRAACDMHKAYVNKDRWEELPPDLREILIAEMEWFGRVNYYTYMWYDMASVQELKDYGCIIEPLPADINVAILAEAEKYYAEQAAKDPFYAEVWQSQTDFRKLYDELMNLHTPLLK